MKKKRKSLKIKKKENKEILKLFLIISCVLGTLIFLFYYGMLGNLIHTLLVLFIGIFLPLALLIESAGGFWNLVIGFIKLIIFLIFFLFLYFNFDPFYPLYIMIFGISFILMIASSNKSNERI